MRAADFSVAFFIYNCARNDIYVKEFYNKKGISYEQIRYS